MKEERINPNFNINAKYESMIEEANKIIKVYLETTNLYEEDGDKLIGGLTATRDFDSIYVDYLVVDKDYRKKGIGIRLILQLENIAREKKVKRIMLNTYSFQSPGFYERMGFKANLIIDPVFSNYKHYHFIKEIL